MDEKKISNNGKIKLLEEKWYGTKFLVEEEYSKKFLVQIKNQILELKKKGF
jgi:hypothetical protein